jgi:hypothetical protein
MREPTVTNSLVRGFGTVGCRCYHPSVATIERAETLVSLTEAAAEKIKELQVLEPEGEANVLRVAVQGGGCSGFEYALGFDRGLQEGDRARAPRCDRRHKPLQRAVPFGRRIDFSIVEVGLR